MVGGRELFQVIGLNSREGDRAQPARLGSAQSETLGHPNFQHSGHWGQIRPGKCLVYSLIRSNIPDIFQIRKPPKNKIQSTLDYSWNIPDKSERYSTQSANQQPPINGLSTGIFQHIPHIFWPVSHKIFEH